jgi:hypothetical protein
MRQWNVDTRMLCNKHLLGEHVEHHMFIGSMKKNISVRGYIEKGLLEVHTLKDRHDIIALEMEKRGMNHKTPLNLDSIILWKEGNIEVEANIQNLRNRCVQCGERIEKFYLLSKYETGY